MILRGVLTVSVVLAGFCLSGCYYTTGGYSPALTPSTGNQAVLDGTIVNRRDWQEEPPPRRTARKNARVIIGAVDVGTPAGAAPGEPVKVYSDEWWALEKQKNERLNRQMTICRGC